MKKRDFIKEASLIPSRYVPYRRRRVIAGAIAEAVTRFEARIGGKIGAEAARERFHAALTKLYTKTPAKPSYSHAYRLDAWKCRSARFLAAMAGHISDEHGSRWISGDYHSITGLDYIPAHLSTAAPYCDTGGKGLGLVAVKRTRTYAKSCKWRPSSVTTKYLVGRNETGTYFSHPVSPHCDTIAAALQWIWSGQAEKIIQRQGDIALIAGNGGPRIPARIPSGHRVERGHIVHASHTPLPLPDKGQPGALIPAKRKGRRKMEDLFETKEIVVDCPACGAKGLKLVWLSRCFGNYRIAYKCENCKQTFRIFKD